MTTGYEANAEQRACLDDVINGWGHVVWRALSLHVAVDERGTLGQRTKEMVENVTENRRYSIIFAQESIW